MSRVWLLNLDAELEIEARAPYPGPLAALAKRPALREALTALIPEGERVLLTPPRQGELTGTNGFSWSPTPQATALLRAGGAEAQQLPIDVLRRVMSRGFSAGLGLHLVGACWHRAADAAVAHARSPSPSGRWLARRAFGFAGKARRAFGEPQSADERFVASAAAEGGVLIEPFVTVIADFGLHGFVDATELTLGEPVGNDVGPGGVFRSSRRADAGELAVSERGELVREAQRAGQALQAAGYRGPYGIDAFRYTISGREGFQPRCEINARYSMGWAVGMGETRPDL